MNRQSNQITALYCRIDGGTYRPGASDAILNQQKALTQYAQSQGLQNIRIFSDCGFSGNNLNRPEFQRMLREIEAGNVADLVVKNLDRLYRNMFDIAALLEKTLPQHGVTLHSLDCRYLPVLAFYETVAARGGRT